jgi:hypothetical protein
MTTHDVSVRRLYYGIVKPSLEAASLVLKQRRPWLHLAECCSRVLRAKPLEWRVYREAMKAGCASEFQRPKRLPSRPTSVDRVWFDIEAMARMLVATSAEPLTLRAAVVRLVEVRPDLVERYAAAIRRQRRAQASGRSKRATRLASRGRSRRGAG